MIWLRPERSGHGPRPAHSRAAIAEAAIALADAEGIDAVSMRRIAAALGAGTMSLYNYVPKKEQLFDLMLDAATGEYRLPDEPSGDARADLTLLAHQELAALRRHPWLAELVVTRPSMGPNTLRAMEFFFGAVAGLPWHGSTKLEMMAQLTGYVCVYAQWERTAARGDRDRFQAETAAYLTKVVATGRYPHLAEALADSATGAPPDQDTVFARSLDRLITPIVSPPS
jgi:AcrR family transcriptional regulator